MYKKLKDITQGVIKKIGLVNGTAVQTYTEPQIKSAVQDAFYMVFRKRYWEHLSDWYTYQLDGVTGQITTDIKEIVKEWQDASLFYAGENTTGNRLVQPVNNEHLQQINGAQPLYYTPLKFLDVNFTTRVFQFWPKTATGAVTFYARTCPDEFADNQIVPFAADMMEWAAAWMMLEIDGMNPGNAAKCQSMFQISYNDITSSMSDDVIGHGHGGHYRDWRSV